MKRESKSKSEIDRADRIKCEYVSVCVWNKVKEKRNMRNDKNINNSFTVNWCSFYF